jgi:uncharacterized protein
MSQVSYSDLLTNFVRGLVNNPEQATVEEVVAQSTVVLTLKCAPEDNGRIIGKQGKMIMALRTLLQAIAARNGCKIFIEVPYMQKNRR